MLVCQKPASDSEPEDETTTYPAVAKKPSIRYPAPQSSQSAASSSKTSEKVDEAELPVNQASATSDNATPSPALDAEAMLAAYQKQLTEVLYDDDWDRECNISDSESDMPTPEPSVNAGKYRAAEELAENAATRTQQPGAGISGSTLIGPSITRSKTVHKAPEKAVEDMSSNPPAYTEEAVPGESSAHQAPVSLGYYYGRDSKRAREDASSIQQRDPIDDTVAAPFDSLELVDSYTPGTGEDRAIGPTFSSSESLAVEKKKPKSFFKRVSKVLGGSKKGPYPEFHGNLRIE
ncbi:hypothetical protein DFP72DRAFT_925651 [Ephemerocybe angulata]|uniref:Uncharacterized protein n=1 Tax=Ephemerocybe angulata TaxID=980116 RepID=A0A8H6HH14_9AGAR|nr:hypothetical protein DFP72DRAFT_925651 [Tulosesus angulatus]